MNSWHHVHFILREWCSPESLTKGVTNTVSWILIVIMSIIWAQIAWPCTLHRILSWAFNTRSNINNMLIQLTNNHFYFFGIPPFFPAKVDFCNVSRPKSDVISVLVIFENFLTDPTRLTHLVSTKSRMVN